MSLLYAKTVVQFSSLSLAGA